MKIDFLKCVKNKPLGIHARLQNRDKTRLVLGLIPTGAGRYSVEARPEDVESAADHREKLISELDALASAADN